MTRFILILCSFFLQANTHRPEVLLNEVRGKPNEGYAIYQHFCANCHSEDPPIQVGAPRYQNKKDWQSRSQTGLKALFKTTEEGVGLMPPRGGCFECSDEALLLAIKEMLPIQTP